MRPPAYRGSGWPGVPVERRTGAATRIPEASRPENRGLRLRAFVWNIVWELARRLPEVLAFWLAGLVGRVAFRLARRSRLRLSRNLLRVTGSAVDPGDHADLVRDGFRSYCRYWVEAFRAADIEPADLDRRTTTAGLEHLDAALEQGRGAIVLLAHHGSWDMAARWAETHGYHLAVVAEIVRPRQLFEKFVNLREGIGLEVVPLRRGDDLTKQLCEVLAANHLVGLLSDRDLSRRGPIVELFGEPCRLPHGPVTLAQRTGAPVVPVTMLQRPRRRWHVEVFPSVGIADLDLEQAARHVASGIEAIIRTDPSQWHAFSPIWLADQPDRAEPRLGATLPRDVGTS